MNSSRRYTNISTGEDPVDFAYLESFYHGVSSPIIDHYFRAKLIGFENIPETGPVILASNHSGNAFPHDSFVLDQLAWRADNFAKNTKIRPLFSPMLAVNWWMRPFGLDNWWRKFGAVDQTYLNFDRILARGGRVIYYPEGIPGIGKGFNRRYRLQPFQPSFIKLAARYDVPVVPVYSINAEWINPASLTYLWLNKISNRLLGVPFIPLPIALLALIFPFFFYFGFPSNMKFITGKPVSIRDWIRSKNNGRPDDPDRETSEKTAEEIRLHMQEELDRLARKHGSHPYNISTLFHSFRNLHKKRWITSPFGWPILFTRHFRDYYENSSGKTVRNRFLRDWDLIGYYLPFGWLFLSLFRRFRKQPYGNRGLDKESLNQKEGRYIWSIARDD